MGKDSKISWTNHTFNPWWGCTKIDAGCKNCYAKTLAARFGYAWGAEATLRTFGMKHWAEPLKWDREAKESGVRARVFCGSMCDVFERRAGLVGGVQDAARSRLWELIDKTPHLDWLLLTKRPENVVAMMPGGMRKNVWVGASASNREDLARVAKALVRIPAAVRFLSLEPLLEELAQDLRPWLGYDSWRGSVACPHGRDPWTRCEICEDKMPPESPGWAALGVQWVITGCESGPNARPMEHEWAAGVWRQCLDAGVPFFFKQETIRGKLDKCPTLGGETWRQMPEVKS